MKQEKTLSNEIQNVEGYCFPDEDYFIIETKHIKKFIKKLKAEFGYEEAFEIIDKLAGDKLI